MSPSFFGAYCTIFRENSYHFSHPSVYCEGVTMVELQSVKYIFLRFWFVRYYLLF